ncbi:MAG: cation-translocating P-type ATPase [Patescibacteria group bacterium]|nr:cation-translocating P-type ATPase [Patescibacteria group bacterium]
MPIDFTRFEGLSEGKVISNQKKYGLNQLDEKKRKGVFTYVKKIVEEPMLLLLLIAAGLYFVIGNTWDGVLMLAGVLLMIGIDLYQENKTDRAVEALMELSTPQVKVIRDGKLKLIQSNQLVVEDLMVVQEGDRIAGDGTILADSNFSVDESLLTGESGALFKTTQTGEKITDKNKVYSGTLALSGQAVIKISAVGISTQYGKIGESLATIEDDRTPLQKQTKKIIKIFGAVGATACVLLMAIVYASNKDIVDSLLKGLTLAISVIPEEIPVVLTIFAALGAYRLTRKKTLVRKINAVETLGHITTLCTDKTGTLTENRMALQELYTDGKVLTIEVAKTKKEKLLPAMTDALLASQPNPYDPMDISIHELAKKIGLNPTKVYNKRNLIHEYGFDQKLKFMGHLWSSGEERDLVIKGSAEQVVARCSVSESKRKQLLEEIDTMAGKGLRVLAVASKKFTEKREPNTLSRVKNFNFVALLGFRDPPRADAKKAVSLAQQAGITVRMITGDHPQTAMHIAKAVGICCSKGVVTGKELSRISETDLTDKIHDMYVFARINPEQKLKIISALKRRGEVVAMMGDGVNDAPSLKNADIGVAMGKRGTNVARESADIILLDDRLLTVVQAVGDGRRIFDNIQKAIGYIFIVHVYIILTALLIPLSGLPILLTPIHIILLELVIDPTCALVFESIPAEADIMKRKPRNPKKAIISLRRLASVFAIGIMIFIITTAVYVSSLRYGMDTEQARTVGFSVIIWTNLLLVLTSVSHKHMFGHLFDFIKNKTFLSVYLAVIVGLIVLVYVPVINNRFGFHTIPLWLFFGTALLGLIPLAFGEILKQLLPHKTKSIN